MTGAFRISCGEQPRQPLRLPPLTRAAISQRQRRDCIPETMQKPLFEYDPRELSLELLLTLQSALVAKLLLVNRELSARSQGLVALSDGLPNVEDERAELIKSAHWCDKVNVILEAHLVEKRQVGFWSKEATEANHVEFTS
jgi:hypothetical protein